MRFFKSLPLAAAMVLVAGVGVAQAGGDADVKYRKHILGSLGQHMGAISTIMQGQLPHQDNILAHAESMAAMARLGLESFRAETAGATEETRAKPEIWQNWDDFSAEFTKLEEETAALVTAAASGDMAAVGAQLGRVGGVCRSCHGGYRE